MASLKRPDSVEVALSGEELALILRALRLVDNFGLVDDMDAAIALLADLNMEGA